MDLVEESNGEGTNVEEWERSKEGERRNASTEEK